MLKRWDEIFRYTITLLGMSFFVGSVFFAFTGNWEFIGSFSYWFDTIGSTTFAWFLRYLWQPKGEEVQIDSDDDIREKEKSKGDLIGRITNANVTDKLKEECDKKDHDSKLNEWYNHCDEKLKHFKSVKLIPFKKYFISKWEREFNLVKEYKLCVDKENYQGEFNLDTIKIEYYEYDMGKILSTTYRQSLLGKRVRYSRGRSLKRSYRINIVTFLVMAVFSGLQLFINDVSTDDVLILGGKLVMFMLNIRSGFKIGIDGIKVEYNADLTDDLVFLREFVIKNKIA